MLDTALAASAFLMGLAGVPHCLAMCGTACVGVTGLVGCCEQGGAAAARAMWGLQLGRWLSYATAGAVAAASVNLLAQLGQSSALLRPLWVLLHAAALLLGLALLWRGRQPAWLETLGQNITRRVQGQAQGRELATASSGFSPQALRKGGTGFAAPLRAGMVGLAWVAWPCGLVQSALLVAALASGPLHGALVMSAFALPSGLGLALGTGLLLRWQRLGDKAGMQGGAAGVNALRWSVRLSGLGLALASGWALGHGVWEQVAAFCR